MPSAPIGNSPPQRYVRDLVDFFNHANLGMFNNQPLQNYLYFLHSEINGKPNPLYGILPTNIVTSLFLRYFKLNPLRVPGEFKIRASPEMRKFLGDVMRNIIDSQVILFSEGHPELRDRLNQKAEELKMAINNPDMQVDPRVGYSTFFNPNNLTGTYLSEIVNESVAKGGQALTAQEFEALRPLARLVYQGLPEFQGRDISVESIFQAQKDVIQ